MKDHYVVPSLLTAVAVGLVPLFALLGRDALFFYLVQLPVPLLLLWLSRNDTAREIHDLSETGHA
jgi:hypothetical protein